MNRSVPSDAARARLFATIAATPSRSRGQQRRLDIIVRCAVFALLALALAALPIRYGERAPWTIVLLALAWALAAAVAWLARARRTSMVGRPARELAVAIAAAALGPLAASLIVGLGDAPLGFARHMPCLLTSLAVGAAPAAVLAWRQISVGGALVSRHLVGASVALTGAFAGGVVVVLHCPDASLGHLVFGHVAALPAAAAVGALALGHALRSRESP